MREGPAFLIAAPLFLFWRLLVFLADRLFWFFIITLAALLLFNGRVGCVRIIITDPPPAVLTDAEMNAITKEPQ